MILTNDQKFVICTPPKTGSSSLLATLVDRLGVAHKHRPDGEANRHGTLYEGKAERILIVRHGLERWSSLFWFAFKKKTQFLHSYAEQGPDAYVEKWFESREKDDRQINNMTLLSYYEDFKPKTIFKIEDGLEKVLEYIGVKDEEVAQNNINDLNFGWEDTKNYLSPANIKRLEALFKPELKLFKYA